MNIIINKLPKLQNEDSIALAILSLGLLNRNQNFIIQQEFWDAYFNSPSPLIKLITAISLAKNPLEDDVLFICSESLQDIKEINSQEFLFNETYLEMYICHIFIQFGKTKKSVIIPELIQMLTKTDRTDCFHIAITIIELISSNKDKNIIALKFNELEEVEQLALVKISEHDCWADVVFPLEMKHKGLPHTREQLIEYINHE